MNYFCVKNRKLLKKYDRMKWDREVIVERVLKLLISPREYH